MNGQYAIKGYLIQSLVALLDSFETEWEKISVEPNDESEKVDILWIFKEGRRKVVQVKSSKNTITFSSAKKWANELITQTDADEYELILVGYVDQKIHKNDKIENVTIINRNLSTEDFESILLVKINSFFETKGKNSISTKLARLFVRSLTIEILQQSVKGEVVERTKFENDLFDSLQSVEKYLEQSAYSSLLPNDFPKNKDISTIVMEHIFKLIGWEALNTNEVVEEYNGKLGKDEVFKIDFWGDYDSPLKDSFRDVIYVNKSLDGEYLYDYTELIKKNIHSVRVVREDLINQKKISTDNSIEYCVQFLLSLDKSEQNKPIVELNRGYKNKLMEEKIIYYTIDNEKANFLISSIITARDYRKKLETKFLYPITEDNSQIDKIGKRDTYMPPQFLNSSILPIIKEDKKKISILLFCSDPYSKDRLRKVIWLLIRLTSGLANEYKIYFVDYESPQNSNEVNEVIRSYKDNNLIDKISIEKLRLCNSSELYTIPLNKEENLKNEQFDESANKKLKIESHLIDYLPYGDSLKPFLASDAITSEDLKIFLEKKGIYLKTSNKTKIIQLMTSMLFSSLDIELLVEYVNIDKKIRESSSAQYNLIDENKQMSELFRNKYINQDELQEGLNANIISIQEIKPKNDTNSYEIKIDVEQRNPNKQALVSVVYSKAIVTATKVDGKILFEKEYDSKIGRVVAERTVKQLSKQLIQNNEVEDRCIEVKFSEFDNKERVNFLLSFTDINSSSIFKKFNVKSFKYMFDESTNLPEEYQDKIGKECIAELKGKNLDTIKELQDDNLKEFIFGEEFEISYKYNINGISGMYLVTLNFSKALGNKPTPDGVFNIKTKIQVDNKCKNKVSNVNSLESELKKELNRLKSEKLRQFNKEML